MFRHHDASGYVPVIDGIRRKTLVYGEKTLMSEFRIRAGSVLPDHEHPHEQTGYLVSGRLRLTIAGETFEARPGDSWCVPGGVPHRAEVLEDSVVIEVFAPLREDYLP